MPDKLPLNDLQSIWLNQPTEPLKMSSDTFLERARQRQSRSRFEARLSMSVGLACALFFAWTYTQTHGTLAQMGWGLLSLWGIYAAFHAYKWIRPKSQPQSAAVSTCLEFYRGELERRRDHLQHRWWRSRLPVCILGMIMVIQGTGARNASPNPFMNAIPFLGVLLLWAIAFFFVKKKLGRENLQQEIEELRAFERERTHSS